MVNTPHPSLDGPLVTTRRHALKGAGAILAALALSATNPRAQGQAFAATTLQNLSDVDILNFALKIEHLQAAFYEQAIGTGVLSENVLNTFTRMRDHENQHINRLTQVVQNLGGTPQEREAYNFGDLNTEAQILQVAQTLEEVGVGAYSGVARSISDRSIILAGLASILQIEAAHSAVVRTQGGGSPTVGAFGTALPVDEATNQIGQYIQ